VKFLVDAQLPSSLATLLRAAGHDAVHVSTLPSGNRTPDSEIARRADSDQRVVVTKDRDFRDSHLLSGTPRSLPIATTGNIQNRDLLALFERHIDVIAEYLTDSPLVELSRDRLVAHASSNTKQ